MGETMSNPVALTGSGTSLPFPPSTARNEGGPVLPGPGAKPPSTDGSNAVGGRNNPNEDTTKTLGINQPPPEPKKERPEKINPKILSEAMEDLKKYISKLPADVSYKVDQDSGITFFQVINPVTREVIRQFPPDEIIALSKRLRSMGDQEEAGILLNHEG
jgi:flagellar protein FlaG